MAIPMPTGSVERDRPHTDSGATHAGGAPGFTIMRSYAVVEGSANTDPIGFREPARSHARAEAGTTDPRS